jgi:hypothetical protein
MIPGYIGTYKQIEYLAKKDIDMQIELFAVSSNLYDKNKLRKAIQVYKAAKELKYLVSAYNIRQQIARQKISR